MSQRDADRARGRALDLCDELITQWPARQSGPYSFDSLKELREVLAIRQDLASRSSRVVPAVALLLLVSVIAVLDWVKVPQPEVSLDLLVSRLEVVTKDVREDLARPTEAFFSPSKWVRVSRLFGLTLPSACTASISSASEMRIEPNAASPVSVGLGDSERAPTALRVAYGYLDDGVQFAIADGTTLSVPLTVSNGTLKTYQSDPPKVVTCQIDELARIDLKTDAIDFAPTQVIGPLTVGEISVEEREVTQDSSVLGLSSVHSGVIDFASIPGGQLHLAQGDRLDITPSAAGATLFIQLDKGGLRATIRGRLTRLAVAGKDVRPSVLNYLYSSPPVKLIGAAFTALAALIISVVRWLGYKL